MRAQRYRNRFNKLATYVAKLLILNMCTFIPLPVAGSLLLARSGVCVVGDVNLHKKDTRETLQRGRLHAWI